MYDDQLRDGGPGVGWLYGVDRFACSSDLGEWCIYCEKGNDVGVIGLRADDSAKKFHGAMNDLFSKPIGALVGGNSSILPFSRSFQLGEMGCLKITEVSNRENSFATSIAVGVGMSAHSCVTHRWYFATRNFWFQ